MSTVSIRPLYGDEYASEEAVLLINLGSPISPEVDDVQRFLGTFLMDERVISISPFWRSLLVRQVIVPLRAPHSSRNYRKIWDDETKTFPLVRHSALIAHKLSQSMHCPVALAMRYSVPSVDDALQALVAIGAKRVKVLPLYPHYTRSSFETSAVHVLARSRELGLDMELWVLPTFYHDAGYRRALADSVRPHLQEPFDKVIVSMHGIPLSHLSRPCRVDNGNTRHCHSRQHSPQEIATCYRLHCERTTDYLCRDLGLRADQIELVYQSRLGWHEWIKPYFSRRVKQWAREGTKRVVVLSPCFVCDCLETLEEIEVGYRQAFLASGGKSFTYVPCLNSGDAFIEVLHHHIANNNPLDP